MKTFVYTLGTALIFFAMLMAAVPTTVMAGPTPGTPSGPAVAPAVTLPNPLRNDNKSVPILIGRVIQVAMGLLGALTLVAFVSGGWLWVTSAGFPQRVQQGLRTMLFAVAGLFVIFAAYGILDAFINVATTGST